MGICQCIEANNNCFTNEIYSEKHFYNVQNQQTDNNEEMLLVKNKNVNVYSNYNNFKHTKPKNRDAMLKNVLNESSKSEVLFEDFSYVSKTIESSVDYYQNSKNMFDFINNIRIYPEKYINSINSIINEYKLSDEVGNGKRNNLDDKTKENINVGEVENQIGTMNNMNILTTNNNSNNLNELIKNYLKEEENMNKLIIVRDFLQKLVETYERKADLIIWSEKVYLTAYEYLIEVEEKVKMNTDLVQKSSSQRVSEKLKFNSNCIEFNIDGLFPPELTVFFLLLENTARLKSILIDNYQHGAACLFPTKSSLKARTLLYLVNKNTKVPKLSGINPMTGKHQNLSVDESIFDNLCYKHLIMDGFYTSDGEILKVTFFLKGGEKIEDEFLLPQDS